MGASRGRIVWRHLLPAIGDAPKVRQSAYVVARAHKSAALTRVLDQEDPKAAIVFCRTRAEVDEVTTTLNGRGYTAEALHGGLSQEQRDRVVTMASMVDKAIARALEALRLQNVALAEEVRRSDNAINRLQQAGEENAITMIALQGPVGADVRRVASSMAIFSNLERMGDYAAGIAKIVAESAGEEPIKPLEDIPAMAVIAREMLDAAIVAYINDDINAARAISERDDELDELYDAIVAELMDYMSRDSSTIERATHLLWVAHNLERIGDRVTNICERVVYIVTGEIEELDGGNRSSQRFSRNGSSDNGTVG